MLSKTDVHVAGHATDKTVTAVFIASVLGVTDLEESYGLFVQLVMAFLPGIREEEAGSLMQEVAEAWSQIEWDWNNGTRNLTQAEIERQDAVAEMHSLIRAAQTVATNRDLRGER